MRWAVGLDCGGTCTRALFAEVAGSGRRTGTSGAANWATTPRDAWKRHVADALGETQGVVSLCACVAGLQTIDDRAAARLVLAELAPGAAIEALPDYEAVLAASDDPEAVCVIAGTGSVVVSRSAYGTRKSGGAGPLLGDVGSAGSVGLAAVRTVIDGGGTARLREAVESQLGAQEPDELVARFYRMELPVSAAAQLASVIAEDVVDGAPYARKLVRRAMTDLARLVARHLAAHHLARREWRVQITGGLWRAGECYRSAFAWALEKAAAPRSVTVSSLEVERVTGALRLALRSIA